jgi:hypothetical protein
LNWGWVVSLGKKLLWRNTFISIENSIRKPVACSGHRTFLDHGFTLTSSTYKYPDHKARRKLKSKLRGGDRKKEKTSL